MNIQIICCRWKACRRPLIKDSHISYGMESNEVDIAWKNVFTLNPNWGD